jgi:hypothetical protein
MLLAWGYLLAAMLIGIYTISGAVTRVGSPLHWGLCVLSIGAMALVVGVCWLAWDPPEDAPHAQD